MDKHTVLHIIGGGEIGGAEKHILNLLQGMDRSRFTPRLCCLFSEPFAQLAQEAGIDVDVIDMRSKYNVGAFQAMKNLLLRHRVDIVHTHGVRANLVGRLGARMAGIKPIVTTIHSVLEQDYPSFWARVTNQLMEQMTLGYVQQFVTVSEGLKADLVSKGISQDKITTIYNGIDFAQFKPRGQGEAWRQKLGIAPDKLVVGILARLHPVKGHQYFLEAADRIRHSCPNVHFLIVGSGLGKEQVLAQVERLNLQDQVTLTGFVDDIVGIYDLLDVLVISSLSEGFGLTAVEAMAMQVPVVATNVGGLPEVIQDGVSGYLVPPANGPALAGKVLRLLSDNQLAQTIASSAFEWAESKFTVQAMIDQTQALYTKILQVQGDKHD